MRQYYVTYRFVRITNTGAKCIDLCPYGSAKETMEALVKKLKQEMELNLQYETVVITGVFLLN